MNSHSFIVSFLKMIYKRYNAAPLKTDKCSYSSVSWLTSCQSQKGKKRAPPKVIQNTIKTEKNCEKITRLNKNPVPSSRKLL